MSLECYPFPRAKRCTRRRFAELVATGLCGSLAGCSAIGADGDPFDDITVDGPRLVVKLSDDVNADVVELVAPDGSTFVDKRAHDRTVSLPLLEPGYASTPTHYRPGEHTVVAKRGDERLGERAVSLEPSVEITDLSLPSEPGFNPVVMLENTGTGPTLLTYLGFANVPNPTPPPDETTGFDPTTGTAELVSPGSLDVQSESMPFAFRELPEKADELSCPGRLEVEVSAETVHGNRITRTFPVRFDGDIENVLWLSHRCSNVTVIADGD